MKEATHLIAREVVACGRWRWLPGMLTLSGLRVVSVDDDGYAIGVRGYESAREVELDDLPDLRDPATLGCVLALAREAYRCASLTTVAYIEKQRVEWRIDAEDCAREDIEVICNLHGFASEAQALVIALAERGESEVLVAALEAAGTQERGEEDGA
jgi:hypothetical protein